MSKFEDLLLVAERIEEALKGRSAHMTLSPAKQPGHFVWHTSFGDYDLAVEYTRSEPVHDGRYFHTVLDGVVRCKEDGSLLSDEDLRLMAEGYDHNRSDGMWLSRLSFEGVSGSFLLGADEQVVVHVRLEWEQRDLDGPVR